MHTLLNSRILVRLQLDPLAKVKTLDINIYMKSGCLVVFPEVNLNMGWSSYVLIKLFLL
jgi:hypothetical protein